MVYPFHPLRSSSKKKERNTTLRFSLKLREEAFSSRFAAIYEIPENGRGAAGSLLATQWSDGFRGAPF